MVGPSNVKVFKKAAPNGKLTAYLTSRDFVDHVGSQTTPVEGVLVVEENYLQGRKVFARVAVTYRYGREGDEMMGLSFCKEFILVNTQVGPGTNDLSKPSEVQDRLIKKLGANTSPFKVELPDNAPASVALEGGDECEASLGVIYDLRFYVGDKIEENPHKRNSVTFAVRKVQYAQSSGKIKQPQTIVSKSFMLSPGKLNLEINLPQDIYFHGDTIKADIIVNNASKKSVKKVMTQIIQHVEVTMTSNMFTRVVAGMESKEGCPITPGSNFKKTISLTPAVSSHKRKAGLALDGGMKDQDANLASSTLVSGGKDVNDSLGIIVSYSMRVKVDCGAIAGELKADLPFKIVHPDPSKLTRDGQIQVEEFKNLRRGQSVADD